MKKTIILGFCILLLLTFNANAAQSEQKPSPIFDIAVYIINQNPDPVEPGRYVDLRFKFDNNGSGVARNVQVELLPQYPFSLEPGAGNVKNVGTIQSRQKGDNGVIVKYRLKVDENAVEGKNQIKIRYKMDDYGWIQPEEFDVNVQTHDAILSVDFVSSGKQWLEPGTSDNLKVKVSNRADSLLEDIQVDLLIGKLPFVPINSTNEKSIHKIDSKDSYEFNFKLMANPDAKAGVYQLPISISYSDELGKKYLKNGTIGIIIGAKPDLSVTLDQSGVYEKGMSGEIIIKAVNKGVTNVKFSNMKLSQSEDYKILSSDEVYLGNIDSDDFQTAGFKIYIESGNKKEVELPIRLEYKDANNNDYKEDIRIKLNIYSASDAKRFGLKKGNGFIGIIIVMVIVASGLFYYIKYKNKKKKA